MAGNDTKKPKAARAGKRAASPKAKRAASPKAKRAAPPKAERAAPPKAKRAAPPKAKRAAPPKAERAAPPKAERAAKDAAPAARTKRRPLVEVVGTELKRRAREAVEQRGQVVVLVSEPRPEPGVGAMHGLRPRVRFSVRVTVQNVVEPVSFLYECDSETGDNITEPPPPRL